MKKIFCIAFLIIATPIYSQIKIYNTGDLIGNVEEIGVLKVELREKNEIVTFLYRVLKYEDFRSYKFFVFKKSDLDAIYDLFVNSQESKKNDSITVELETGDLLIFEYRKSFGIKYIEVFHQSNGVREILPSMTTRQIRKLFGKL